MLFEQLHCLAHHITTTACACRRSARFNAHHAVVAWEHKVFDTQLFSVEVNSFEHVNDGGQHLLGECEGAVVLGVAANLQNPFAHFGKCGRQVRRCGAFANAALAINGKNFGIANFHIGVELNLQAALAVEFWIAFHRWERQCFNIHGVAPSYTPSRRSSSSSLTWRRACKVSASGCQ